MVMRCSAMSPEPKARRLTSLLLLWRGLRCRHALCRCLGCRLLFRTRTGKDADHRVVALVAGILVNLIAGVLQANNECPGLRPGLRVVNSNGPVQVVRSRTREAFGYLHVGRRTLKAVDEVRGFHDQRVPLPMSARIAVKLADV